MSDESDKARGASISFKPFSIYERAVAFGADCKPSRSPSSVVCEALTEFFEKRGINLTEDAPNMELLDKISAAIAIRPELKSDIEKLLRGSRRNARKAA